MFQYTAIVLVCLAQVALASDYGKTADADYSPKNTYGNDKQGYPGYDDDRRVCRHVRNLHINGQETHRASIHEFERKGKSYLKFSCKNHRNAYALVAEKDGSNTVFETVTLSNTVLLSTGFNVDFVAQCRRGRVQGRGVNGDRHTIKRVTCVKLSAPTGVTAL